MKRIVFSLLLLVTLSASAGTPPPIGVARRQIKCTVCEGTGHIELVPPDHGQNKGRAGKDPWNIKCKCPICKGSGKRTLFRMDVVPPYEATEGLIPCQACGWCGIVKCRRCNASGLMPCKASTPKCVSGWAITDVKIGSGKNNHHTKKAVEPCRECAGVGKVICPFCNGTGGELCRKCNGIGHDKQKEEKEREKREREEARKAAKEKKG